MLPFGGDKVTSACVRASRALLAAGSAGAELCSAGTNSSGEMLRMVLELFSVTVAGCERDRRLMPGLALEFVRKAASTRHEAKRVLCGCASCVLP